MTALVVDKAGLARKLRNKPKAFLVYELVQNAWDEDCTEVHVDVEKLAGRPACRITVEDNSPEGFASLDSVYTLFRDSKKADDPTLRGRFELGEKLVIALAQKIEVISTKGSVIIEGDKRTHYRKKTNRGSIVCGTFKMTTEEFEEVSEAVKLLIPPPNRKTYVNGVPIPYRLKEETLHDVPLPTIVTDEDGALKTRTRQTTVSVYEPVKPGEAWLYEMGIPILPLPDDRWSLDVGQRVPVNWERNNVPPSYLRALRVAVLNGMSHELSNEDAGRPWVTEAIDDSRATAGAVRNVIRQRFGNKTVIADPSDPEGTKLAASQGYNVIPGGSLPKGAWEHVRDHGIVLPAGQVTPGPKPNYADGGRPEFILPEEKWTDGMCRVATLVKRLGRELLKREVTVVFTGEVTLNFGATWADASSTLKFNYGRLGKAWFDFSPSSEPILSLIIHEFGHAFSGDHLSSKYHEGLCKLGARLATLALTKPEVFNV